MNVNMKCRSQLPNVLAYQQAGEGGEVSVDMPRPKISYQKEGFLRSLLVDFENKLFMYEGTVWTSDVECFALRSTGSKVDDKWLVNA